MPGDCDIGLRRRAASIVALVEARASRAAPEVQSARIIAAIDLLLPRPGITHDPDLRPTAIETLADWRRQDRWIGAAMRDQPEPAEALRGASAARRLDAWQATAEWAEMALDPEIRTIGIAMREATASLLRGDTDQNGRAIPVGRILGIQPPGPATAGPEIARARRDRIFREARAAVQEWQVATDREAAALMLADLARYRAGGWQADRENGVVPGAEPRRSWFKLLSADGKARPDLTVERLSAILGAE